MEGIDLFVKSLFFVKILSQCRRRKEGKFQSLEVREQAPSHLKTGILVPKNVNFLTTFTILKLHDPKKCQFPKFYLMQYLLLI